MDLATRGGQGSTPSLEAEDGEGQEEDLEEQGVGVMVEEEAVTGEEMGDMGEALDVVVVAMEEVKEVLGVVVVDMDVAVSGCMLTVRCLQFIELWTTQLCLGGGWEDTCKRQ